MDYFLVLFVNVLQAMYALGDWEHALMYFHRVKRMTGGTDREANMGIQRCLEAINNAVNKIQHTPQNVRNTIM